MTSIQWTDRTWNPVRGCTRVSEGCRNCYAERMAARNMPGMRSPTTGEPFARQTPGGPRWTGRVELIPSKLSEPLHWRKPCRVFVNSMSDLFHEALSDEAIDRVFAVMACSPQHTFQVLTKRADRMLRWAARYNPVERLIAASRGLPLDRVMATLRGVDPSEYPLSNVWLGVSVEDQATAAERVPLLLQTPAAKRFVSYEPALGPVNFQAWLWPEMGESGMEGDVEQEALNWVIVGGESGPGARPFNVAWARSVVRQCRAAGVACFVKQLGARAIEFPYEDKKLAANFHFKSHKGGDMAEWPEDLRVREFPS